MHTRHAADCCIPRLNAGPPPGAREREFAAGRIDEQQLEQGKARLEPFHEIARNLPQLAQSGTHRLVRSSRPGMPMAPSIHDGKLQPGSVRSFQFGKPQQRRRLIRDLSPHTAWVACMHVGSGSALCVCLHDAETLP